MLRDLVSQLEGIAQQESSKSFALVIHPDDAKELIDLLKPQLKAQSKAHTILGQGDYTRELTD